MVTVVRMGFSDFATICCYCSPCTVVVRAWTCWVRAVRASCWGIEVGSGGGIESFTAGLGNLA